MSKPKSRSLLSMGFVSLPTSSQTSPVTPAVIQSETSEATSWNNESTSSRPEMEVDDISTLGLVPESPNQPLSDYIYPKTKFGDSYRSFKLYEQHNLPGYITMSRLTVHFAGTVRKQQQLVNLNHQSAKTHS